MKKSLIAAALVSSILGATSAIAAEKGAYGGVGVGATPITDNAGSTFSFGIGFVGGYNVNKYLGIESDLSTFGIGSNVAVLPIVIAAVGYLPLHDGVDVFAKAGRSLTFVNFGSGANTTYFSGTTSMYGFGAEFNPGDKTSYRFGVDHYDLSVAPGMAMSTNYYNITTVVRF